MPLRYRRARTSDIARCWHLLEPDRPLFRDRLWKQLPAVMAELLEREILLLSVVEEMTSGRPVMFGGSVFVDPAFMPYVLTQPEFSATEHLFLGHLAGKRNLLGPRQIAAANAAGTLQVFTLFGVPENIAAGGAEAVQMQAVVHEAWVFFHRGYQFASMWQEYAFVEGRQALENMGHTEIRSVPSSNGGTAWLYGTTRVQSQAKLGSWMSSLMHAPLPVFGFSRPEQKLLEYALLDCSDREFAVEFDLTMDAVKKRWRSIYGRIAAREGELLASAQGADRRRLVLQRVRQSLQEIRPYPAKATRGATLQG